MEKRILILGGSGSFSLKKINPPQTLKISIENAIKAMKKYKINRILVLSSIGAGESYKHAPWFMKLIFKLTNFKIVFNDHNAQETLIKNSGLDWTIARPVGLNENEEMGTLVINYDKTPKPFRMSRKQLAKFFIDNISIDTYSHKTPILSETLYALYGSSSPSSGRYCKYPYAFINARLEFLLCRFLRPPVF